MSGECEEMSNKKERTALICPKSKREKKDSNMSKAKSPCPERKSGHGKDAFGRKVCPKRDEEKKIECHESLKKFFEKDDKNRCKSLKEETKCKDQSKNVREISKCKDTPNKDKMICCAPSGEKSSRCGPLEEIKSVCGRVVGKPIKSGFCKHFGIKYVGAKTKSPSPVEDGYWKIPEPQLMTSRPCLPKVEKSIAAKKGKVGCITPKIVCQQLKKPGMSDFFCIDARNMKMNECIRQYMKTDPSQVKTQCSQFARKRMHKITHPSVSCGHPPPQPSPTAWAGFLPPKHRQIMRRWLPTAGLYVVSTAALTAWVTEWGAVVKYIPFYKDAEEGSSNPSPAQPPEESE